MEHLLVEEKTVGMRREAGAGAAVTDEVVEEVSVGVDSVEEEVMADVGDWAQR